MDVTFANEELGRRTVVVVGKRKDVPFYAPFPDILNWRIGVAVDVGAIVGKAFIAIEDDFYLDARAIGTGKRSGIGSFDI